MRTRECDWIDTKTNKTKYGFQVYQNGHWRHAAENGKPCLFSTKLRRDKKRGEFRNLKVTPNEPAHARREASRGAQS